LATQEIEHSYPHCWRCKEPVIFRATSQWFISMEENDLRKNTLDAIQNKVHFVPKWGRERIYGMIENRPDWCISRQRAWGVPITIFMCEDCGEPVLTHEMAESVLDIFTKEGADAWFDRSKCHELVPEGQRKCTHCGSANLTKGSDILDVWFDSGCSHAAVLEPRGGAYLAGRHVPGGQRPAPGMVPQLFAVRHGHPGHPALQERIDPRFRGGRRRPQDVQEPGQRGFAHGYDQKIRGRDPAPLGGGRGLYRRYPFFR
jgi:hypothetical protein